MKIFYPRDDLILLPVLHRSEVVKVGTETETYRDMRFHVRKDESLFIVSTGYLLDSGDEHIQSQYCPVFLTEAEALEGMAATSFVVGSYDEVREYRASIGDPLPTIKEGALLNE